MAEQAKNAEVLLAEQKAKFEALLAENNKMKKALEDKDKSYSALEKRMDTLEKEKAADRQTAVVLFCAADLADGITLTATYDNGKSLVFDKPFQRKPISLDEFKSFASSRHGGYHLERRNIIVGGNIPEELTNSWDIKYQKGELLDKNTLDIIFDLPKDRLVNVFKDLCVYHKKIVARRFLQGYQKRDERVTREKADALKEFDKSGSLKGLLKEMAENEAKEHSK